MGLGAVGSVALSIVGSGGILESKSSDGIIVSVSPRDVSEISDGSCVGTSVASDDCGSATLLSECSIVLGVPVGLDVAKMESGESLGIGKANFGESRGAGVGAVVGFFLATTSVGDAVGSENDSSVANEVVTEVGDPVGTPVIGSRDGDRVGPRVDDPVSSLVGDPVGVATGDAWGPFEGKDDGSDVIAAAVGKFV